VYVEVNIKVNENLILMDARRTEMIKMFQIYMSI